MLLTNMNTQEPIDLETLTQHPEKYPALHHAMSAVVAIPYIRDIAYFKLQMLRNEIIDV